MKSFTLILFFCCILLEVEAQQDSFTEAFIKKKCWNTYIYLPGRKTDNDGPARFKDIEVLDCRADTSRIGIILSGNAQDEVLFRSTTRNTIGYYLNSHFTGPGATRSILIIIKQLWLTDSVAKPKRGESFPQPYQSRISFRAEMYCKTDGGFLPLAYVDTLLISSNNIIHEATRVLPEILSATVEKAASADIDKLMATKKIVSMGQINDFNRSRYNYAMDQAPVLQKGVYASVEEFLNNQPSIMEFEIKKGDDSTQELYLKDEEGKSYYSRKMWGYCDGEHCFAMMDGNLFPILPAQHAFYVLGSKEYRVKKHKGIFLAVLPSFYAFGTFTASESVWRKLRLYRLNTDSGEIE